MMAEQKPSSLKALEDLCDATYFVVSSQISSKIANGKKALYRQTYYMEWRIHQAAVGAFSCMF